MVPSSTELEFKRYLRDENVGIEYKDLCVSIFNTNGTGTVQRTEPPVHPHARWGMARCVRGSIPTGIKSTQNRLRKEPFGFGLLRRPLV